MPLTRKAREEMRLAGKTLASINKQLERGHPTQARYKQLLRQRNELMAKISGRRTTVVSGGLPELGKRR